MAKANVFFKVDGLVHIQVEADDPSQFDKIAWVKLAEILGKFPEGVAVGEAKVSMILPDQGELDIAKYQQLIDKQEDKEAPATGQYL